MDEKKTFRAQKKLADEARADFASGSNNAMYIDVRDLEEYSRLQGVDMQTEQERTNETRKPIEGEVDVRMLESKIASKEQQDEMGVRVQIDQASFETDEDTRMMSVDEVEQYIAQNTEDTIDHEIAEEAGVKKKPGFFARLFGKT